MMRALLRIAIAVVAILPVAFALQGCTPEDAQANQMPRASSYLARGVVDVEGGLISVRSQHTGQLLDVSAQIGQEVSRGSVLARFQAEAQDAEADAARAELERARAELAAARVKVATLREAMGRLREAVALGAESGQARDELQAQLDAQVSTVPVAQASVAAAEARLRGARAIAGGSVVRAPIDGRVVQLNARIGDFVGAGDGPALFVLRPNGTLIVRASLPSRDASHTRIGSIASVSEVDDGKNVFEGRVVSLGEIARKPDPTLASDDFTSERVVDCVIALNPDARIRIGSLVLVSFN